MFVDLFDYALSTFDRDFYFDRPLYRVSLKERPFEEGCKEDTNEHYLYQEFKDGKMVKEREVEWKNGKKTKDTTKSLEPKKSEEQPKVQSSSKDTACESNSKGLCNKAPKQTNDSIEERLKTLEQTVKELSAQNKELKEKNIDYAVKFAKIKNLF